MLLHYAGDDIYDIYDNFTDEQKGIGAVYITEDGSITPNEYGVMKKLLADHFTPQKNTSYEIFKFRQAIQNTGETLDQLPHQTEDFGFHVRI